MFTGRDIEFIIVRLERAGAEVGEASRRLKDKLGPEYSGPLAADIMGVNRELGDLRRAVVMYESSGDPRTHDASKWYREQQGYPLTTIPEDQRHVEEVLNHIANLDEEQVTEIRQTLLAWRQSSVDNERREAAASEREEW